MVTIGISRYAALCARMLSSAKRRFTSINRAKRVSSRGACLDDTDARRFSRMTVFRLSICVDA